MPQNNPETTFILQRIGCQPEIKRFEILYYIITVASFGIDYVVLWLDSHLILLSETKLCAFPSPYNPNRLISRFLVCVCLCSGVTAYHSVGVQYNDALLLDIILLILSYHTVCVCVLYVVLSSIPFILDVRLVDVPAGVTQEEGHTGFLIHLPSAVLAFLFLARRIQPSLSLVDHEVELCVPTIIVLRLLGIFFFFFFFFL